MAKQVLIDAYNVIRSNPSLARFEEQKGTPATIRRFVQMCWDAMDVEDHWTIVFDGPGDPQTYETDADKRRLEVYFSGELEADEIIIDKARFALSKGRKVVIATSDFEIYEEGSGKISAFDFYDRLVSRPKIVEKQSALTVSSTRILADVINAGHLPPSFQPDRQLLAQVDQVIEYYGDTLALKANKAAARIESLLREKADLIPSPDPEKQVLRVIKSSLRRQK